MGVDAPSTNREAAAGARKRLGANVREHRRRRGLTQDGLARASRLHRTEISLLERGGREARLSTIVRIARALDVPAAALLDGVE